MVIKSQLWIRIKSFFSNTRKRSLALTIFGLLVSLNVIVFAVLFTVKPKSVEKTKAANIEPLNIKVVVLRYFPLDSSRTRLDQDITGFNMELSRIRSVVSSAATHTAEKLTEASRYHGYKDPSSIPFLNYTAIETKEYLNAIPVSNIPAWGKNGVYRPDYRKILEDINICDYVDNKGVSEVWMWGYHHGNIEPDESNMRMGTASRNFWNYSTYGDISNSERWVDDHMPICNKTYVLYNYAYGYEENLGNVIEDHTHQIESVMNELQDSSFLWLKYPGPGRVQPSYRCGWTHYPPNMMEYQGDGNSQHEYIWNSERQALSDCEDWTPEATGTKKLVSCHTWYGTTCLDDGGVGFKVWWMQNLPGYNNGLTYQGRQLRNWWEFIGAFDEAMAKGKNLLDPTPAPTQVPTIAPTPTRTPTPKPTPTLTAKPTPTRTPTPTKTPTSKPTPTRTPTPKPTPSQSPTPVPTPISKLVVYVYASGTSTDGQYPTMELKYEGNTICQWKNVKNYRAYTCTIKKVKNTSDLRIALINASSASNIRRILIIDKLVLNGKTFETESPTTYTYKTRPLQSWCLNQDGYLKTESLECNGYFKYNLSSL